MSKRKVCIIVSPDKRYWGIFGWTLDRKSAIEYPTRSSAKIVKKTIDSKYKPKVELTKIED